MNYSPTTAQPAGGESSGLANGPIGKNELGFIIPQGARPVKPSPLLDQALAAEARALALAAWHRERAGRYLAWSDLPWCAAQYDNHLAEADYQERLAARHRQIAASLKGCDHDHGT